MAAEVWREFEASVAASEHVKPPSAFEHLQGKEEDAETVDVPPDIDAKPRLTWMRPQVRLFLAVLTYHSLF